MNDSSSERTVSRGLMTTKEFRESGLLHHVNQAVLFPLGIALAVYYDGRTNTYTDNFIIIAQDESIVDGENFDKRQAQMENFVRWMHERLGRMKEVTVD